MAKARADPHDLPWACSTAVPETDAPMRIGMLGLKGIPVSYGGVETHVAELAPRLAKRGHDVTVFCRSHCTPDDGEYEGVHIVRLPAVRTKHLEMASHTLLSVLAACLRTFDILHFQSVDPALFAPLAKWRTRIVATSHGQAYRRGKWGPMARWASRGAERVFMTVPDARIAVSRTLQRYYEQRYGRPVVYIPNGVEVCAPIRGDVALRHYGLVPRDYLLFAGRLDPTKGCHLVIQAHLRAGLPQKLVVLGASTYTRSYVAQLHAFRSDKVLFLGHQSGSVFWELLQNCAAFVLASEVEGLSVVLLEAMGQAVPVIYSEIPENVEVAAGVGFGFRPGDVDDLATTMSFVATHSTEARARGAQGKARVLRDFSWDAVVSQTEQTYLSVLRAAAARHLRPAEGRR